MVRKVGQECGVAFGDGKAADESAALHTLNALAMRVGGITAGLRLRAVGHLVARVAVALTRNTVDTVWSDALFQFFNFQD